MSVIPKSMTNSLLDRRVKYLDNYSYKLDTSSSRFGMDTPFAADPMDIDEANMAVWIPFASGERRDGVGDLLEVGGIDTSRHVKNPIVLFDHGKTVTLPVGLSEEPSTKEYMVQIDTMNRTARAKAYFYQGNSGALADDPFSDGQKGNYDHALFCEQLFDLIVKRYVRAGSIGYQVVKAMPMPPDYMTGTPQGLHLLQTLLLEVSAVVMPANADTVRKALAMPKVAGKPLSPVLVKSLAPYAAPRKAQMGYEQKAPNKRGMDEAKRRYDRLVANGDSVDQAMDVALDTAALRASADHAVTSFNRRASTGQNTSEYEYTPEEQARHDEAVRHTLRYVRTPGVIHGEVEPAPQYERDDTGNPVDEPLDESQPEQKSVRVGQKARYYRVTDDAMYDIDTEAPEVAADPPTGERLREEGPIPPLRDEHGGTMSNYETAQWYRQAQSVPMYPEEMRQRYPSPHTRPIGKDNAPGLIDERTQKAQPSENISPGKARQMLEDGTTHGHPLTEKQQRMLGAAVGRGQKARMNYVSRVAPTGYEVYPDDEGRILKDGRLDYTDDYSDLTGQTDRSEITVTGIEPYYTDWVYGDWQDSDIPSYQTEDVGGQDFYYINAEDNSLNRRQPAGSTTQQELRDMDTEGGERRASREIDERLRNMKSVRRRTKAADDDLLSMNRDLDPLGTNTHVVYRPVPNRPGRYHRITHNMQSGEVNDVPADHPNSMNAHDVVRDLNQIRSHRRDQLTRGQQPEVSADAAVLADDLRSYSERADKEGESAGDDWSRDEIMASSDLHQNAEHLKAIKSTRRKYRDEHDVERELKAIMAAQDWYFKSDDFDIEVDPDDDDDDLADEVNQMIEQDERSGNRQRRSDQMLAELQEKYAVQDNSDSYFEPDPRFEQPDNALQGTDNYRRPKPPATREHLVEHATGHKSRPVNMNQALRTVYRQATDEDFPLPENWETIDLAGFDPSDTSWDDDPLDAEEKSNKQDMQIRAVRRGDGPDVLEEYEPLTLDLNMPADDDWHDELPGTDEKARKKKPKTPVEEEDWSDPTDNLTEQEKRKRRADNDRKRQEMRHVDRYSTTWINMSPEYREQELAKLTDYQRGYWNDRYARVVGQNPTTPITSDDKIEESDFPEEAVNKIVPETPNTPTRQEMSETNSPRYVFSNRLSSPAKISSNWTKDPEIPADIDEVPEDEYELVNAAGNVTETVRKTGKSISAVRNKYRGR